jgi:hypothetical protein
MCADRNNRIGRTNPRLLTRVRLPGTGLSVREHRAFESTHDVHDDRLDRRLENFLLGAESGKDVVEGVGRLQLLPAFSLYDGHRSLLGFGGDDR